MTTRLELARKALQEEAARARSIITEVKALVGELGAPAPARAGSAPTCHPDMALLLDELTAALEVAATARMAVTAACAAQRNGWGDGPSSEEIIAADAAGAHAERVWLVLKAALCVALPRLQ